MAHHTASLRASLKTSIFQFFSDQGVKPRSTAWHGSSHAHRNRKTCTEQDVTINSKRNTEVILMPFGYESRPYIDHLPAKFSPTIWPDFECETKNDVE